MSQGTTITEMTSVDTATGAPVGLWAWMKLLRLHQWAKGAFVVIGPVYGHALQTWAMVFSTAAAFLAFGLASSGCYIINDYKDREADRTHPRKRRRPLAAGTIQPGVAIGVAVMCIAASIALPWVAYWLGACAATGEASMIAAGLTSGLVGIYCLNTLLYSFVVKHIVIADVMSLSLGFVLRVLGGCAVVMVEPSTWLLNTTFFLAMFLAFGKRLGERRTMGEANVHTARTVQAEYTEDLLRMVVVVTAVACLVTYAMYVTSGPTQYKQWFNVMWLTMIPATYGLLRAILLLEKGLYDDPTEVAVRDRPFQLAALIFALLTLAIMALVNPNKP